MGIPTKRIRSLIEACSPNHVDMLRMKDKFSSHSRSKGEKARNRKFRYGGR